MYFGFESVFPIYLPITYALVEAIVDNSSSVALPLALTPVFEVLVYQILSFSGAFGGVCEERKGHLDAGHHHNYAYCPLSPQDLPWSRYPLDLKFHIFNMIINNLLVFKL